MARVGEFGHLVHFLRGQRCRRRVLYYKDTVGVGLYQALPRDRVHVLLLDVKALGVGEPVAVELIPAWEQVVIVHGIERAFSACAIDRAVDICDLIDGQTGVEGIGNLDDGVFAHAVDEQVGTRVEQYRALELILPVVVVRKASQACLDAADDDGRFLVGAANEVAIDRYRPVGPSSRTRKVPARLTRRYGCSRMGCMRFCLYLRRRLR